MGCSLDGRDRPSLMSAWQNNEGGAAHAGVNVKHAFNTIPSFRGALDASRIAQHCILQAAQVGSHTHV
jgi:hypothetical protein